MTESRITAPLRPGYVRLFVVQPFGSIHREYCRFARTVGDLFDCISQSTIDLGKSSSISRRTKEMANPARTELLFQYGIIDRPELMIIPIREADVLWRVRISGPGDPVTALLVDRAIELARKLRSIGEEELASRIVIEAEKAQRYNKTGP